MKIIKHIPKDLVSYQDELMQFNVLGYLIKIENPIGSVRSGVDKDGNKWSTLMKNHYGELVGTKGYDGDPIDVFLGPNLENGLIFVIDQIKPNWDFDESKIMLGFDSADQAKEAYFSNYSKGWQGFGDITPAGDNFREWLYDGKKQRMPFHEYKSTPNPIK